VVPLLLRLLLGEAEGKVEAKGCSKRDLTGYSREKRTGALREKQRAVPWGRCGQRL